jgi:hypothetical protein
VFAAIAIALLSDSPGYVAPLSSTSPRYLELLEENTHILYPAIAVLVVALIAFGVISAWRTEDIDVIAKAEMKREIIREMRRQVHGLTVEQLAKLTSMPPLKLVRLLEEMQEGGITESRTDSARITTWRLKGLTT